MPKLTIVTLTYNAERYLEKTIQSVAAQTCKDFDYVILDGGSSDATLAIAERFRPTVSKIISRPDKGALDAFNQAWSELTGDFILLVGGDDWLEPDCVAEIVEAARKNAAATVIKFGMKVWQQSGEALTPQSLLGEPDDGVFDVPAAVYGGCINHALHRSLYERLGLYAHDKWKIYSDRELHLRFSLINPVKAVIGKSLFNFRNHEGSSTGNGRPENIAASMYQSSRMAIEYLRKTDISPLQRRQLQDWYGFCWVRAGVFLLKSRQWRAAFSLLNEGLFTQPRSCLRKFLSPGMPLPYRLQRYVDNFVK